MDLQRATGVRRARAAVTVVALVALLVKLRIATTTYGTEDVRTWTGFAKGVARSGPVGVYGIDFAHLDRTLYNHPPLVGYLLAVVNALASWGVPLRVSLRAASSLADVGSALLVLDLLRTRTGLRRATASGLLVAASPVLVLVSGYHGNTDPIFLALVLLGAYLLVDRDRPFSGGAALGLSLGIKIVPVVVLPVLAVHLLRHRRDLAVRAAAGFGAAVLLVWAPALLTHFHAVTANVLGYNGISYRPWGLVHVAAELHQQTLVQLLSGPGRTAAVALAALVPAALVWRRPTATVPALALSLPTLLLLSPAFGVQYLAWAVAAAYLLDLWSATAYNLLAGVVLFVVYDSWNHGLPWTDVAEGRPFTGGQLVLTGLLWACLALVVVRGTAAVRAAPVPGSYAGSRPARSVSS